MKSGLFLEQFRTVPWAHLDIGGTGYFRKAYPFATARRDRASPTRRSSSWRWRGPRAAEGRPVTAAPGRAAAVGARRLGAC